MTWIPFSKLTVPFCPAEAKWPLTAILSGAVYALVAARGRGADSEETGTGECAEDELEFAMTAARDDITVNTPCKKNWLAT
jgi:hypothetical protein